MKRKFVIISIDDIVRLFADYAGLADFPQDAEAEKLFLNPGNRKIKLQISADSLTGPQQVEEIRFKLKRTYVV